MEAEIGVMRYKWSQAKNCHQPPEAGRGGEVVPSSLLTPWPATSSFQNWKCICFCRRPPSLSWFVEVALGKELTSLGWHRGSHVFAKHLYLLFLSDVSWLRWKEAPQLTDKNWNAGPCFSKGGLQREMEGVSQGGSRAGDRIYARSFKPCLVKGDRKEIRPSSRVCWESGAGPWSVVILSSSLGDERSYPHFRKLSNWHENRGAGVCARLLSKWPNQNSPLGL